MAQLVVGSPATPSTPAIILELLNAIKAFPTQNFPGAEETKSIGDWLRVSSIPPSVDGDDRDFGLEDNGSKEDFVAKPRLAALNRYFNTCLFLNFGMQDQSCGQTADLRLACRGKG